MSASGNDGRRLILARHGQSTFNARNCFTGLRDPPLTEVGVAEARAMGRALNETGFEIDDVFTSALERARRTAHIVLETLDLDNVSITESRALNERDYGILTDLNKDEACSIWGKSQVDVWRRAYMEGPPDGESLRDTLARALPYYVRAILPKVMRRRTVFVVAHGNTLRALIMALEGISDESVETLEIATGEILVYDLESDSSLRAKRAFGRKSWVND